VADPDHRDRVRVTAAGRRCLSRSRGRSAPAVVARAGHPVWPRCAVWPPPAADPGPVDRDQPGSPGGAGHRAGGRDLAGVRQPG